MPYFPFISVPMQDRQSIRVTNSRDPTEQPIAIPLHFDFTAAETYVVDLSTMLQRGTISGIQTLYFDNSVNNQRVLVTVQGSEQRISLRAGWQGYVPVLAPQPCVFDFTCEGSTTGEDVLIELVNVPMPCFMWVGT